MQIRKSTTSDLNSILAIFNKMISQTFAIYHIENQSKKDVENWFLEKQTKEFPILVAVDNNEVLGFATYGQFRPHAGFDTTVEHSIYLNTTGSGVGTALMHALIDIAKLQEKHVMVACIDAENHKSIQFHQRLGFQIVGEMPEIARKFDSWRNLVLLQKKL